MRERILSAIIISLILAIIYFIFSLSLKIALVAAIGGFAGIFITFKCSK